MSMAGAGSSSPTVAPAPADSTGPTNIDTPDPVADATATTSNTTTTTDNGNGKTGIDVLLPWVKGPSSGSEGSGGGGLSSQPQAQQHHHPGIDIFVSWTNPQQASSPEPASRPLRPLKRRSLAPQPSSPATSDSPERSDGDSSVARQPTKGRAHRAARRVGKMMGLVKRSARSAPPTIEVLDSSDNGPADVCEANWTTTGEAPSPWTLRRKRTGSSSGSLWGGSSAGPWARPALPRDTWGEDGTTWQVRGASYPDDGRKVPGGPHLFQLECCDLVHAPTREDLHDILGKPNSRLDLLRQAGDTDTFVLAVNILVPSNPPTSWVSYFSVPNAAALAPEDRPYFTKLASTFFFDRSEEGNRFRDERFKIIPAIVEGSWIVRRAVGNKPALVGTKLKQQYYFTDRSLEIVVDVGSSRIAEAVVGVCTSHAQELAVDLAFCIQGDTVEELPEVPLGGCRWNHASMHSAKDLSLGSKLGEMVSLDLEENQERADEGTVEFEHDDNGLDFNSPAFWLLLCNRNEKEEEESQEVQEYAAPQREVAL